MLAPLTYASMFAGIGGFDTGFNAAGMKATVMVEINENCQKVLAHHFPDVPLMGDIRDVQASAIGKPDVLCGGFPCQDTSGAAPNRAGLAGSRSGMFWEFRRLLDEHLRLVDETRPRWVVIENPEGLLTSPGIGKADKVDRRGWDAAAVFGGLEDLGYGWAYRVVDGGHLGTTQRRRRVIVVGHRGGDPRPAWQVLGDAGSGDGPAAPGAVRGRPGGPRPVASPIGSGQALIWRKSARARAKLSVGGYETWVPAEFANTLTGFDGGGAKRQTHLIAQHGRMRTLTLTEWERLQGFPDGWTEMMSESERFTALGNAIHTGTSEWLGRRMVAVHNTVPMLPAEPVRELAMAGSAG